MKKLANTIKNNLLPFLLMLAVLAWWQLVSKTGVISQYRLPAPTDILATMVRSLPEMKDHILITCFEAGTGFVIAMFTGVFLAVCMDWFALLRKTVYPIVIVSQTIPIITLAPLLMMWFGYGYLPKIVVVILVCFFPICISFFKGIQMADKDLVNLVRSMGANKVQIYRHIKIPFALPSFFSGLKIAATYSVMAAVIGEWIGGMKGLGVYMIRVRHTFSVDKVFASILIITIISLILLKIIDEIEKKVIAWKIKESKGESYE